MAVGGNVLVVLTHPWDDAAECLAAAWPGPTRIASPSDLSRPGWRLRSGAPERARLVAGGEVIDIGAVGGIVTRLGWITPEELTWIYPIDREFVAAEMGAFLLALLSQIAPRVFNPPTPQCLAGPLFSPLEWNRRARAAQFAIAQAGAPATQVIDVIDGRAVDNRFRPEGWAAERLARACGARLLAVSLTDAGEFVHATPFPDLTMSRSARAVAQSFALERAA